MIFFFITEISEKDKSYVSQSCALKFLMNSFPNVTKDSS